MSTIQEVNSAIMFGEFTNEQLNSIISAIKYRRNQLAQEKKRSFRVGGAVKFTSNRNGRTYTGTIEKVKIKYILVSTPQGRYNVPVNMLEAV